MSMRANRRTTPVAATKGVEELRWDDVDERVGRRRVEAATE